MHVIFNVIIFGYLISATVVAQEDEEGIFRFLNENEYYDTQISTPHVLGHFPHHCVGNIHLCEQHGFTLSLWITPVEENPEIPHLYYFSSGGQSVYSEGVFIRQNFGKEFEIGVAKGNRLWIVPVHVIAGEKTNIVLTWHDDLKVFIDGILAGSDALGKQRQYVNSAIDPFPQLVLGAPNDELLVGFEPVVPELEVYNVTHWPHAFAEHSIPEAIGELNSQLSLRCIDTVPGTKYNASDVFDCRQKCANMMAHVSAVKKSDTTSVECICLTLQQFEELVDETDSLQTECSDTSQWMLYWSTHQMWDTNYDLELEVDVVYATEFEYVRPGETVTFNVKTNSDERVRFHIDFGDGGELFTEMHSFGHTWHQEGTFDVNLTAVSRTSMITRFFPVTIEMVEEGSQPEMVSISYDGLSASKEIGTYIASAGVTPRTCSVDFGDGTLIEFQSEDTIITNHYEVHHFADIGFYDILFQCQNTYGSLSDEMVAVATHNQVEYEYHSIMNDVVFYVKGLHRYADRLKVLVDDETVPYTIRGPNVTISSTVFTQAGEYVVELIGNGHVMYTKIIHMQTPVGSLTIETDSVHSQIDTPIEFEFQIESGDSLQIQIDFGDGFTEHLYHQYPNEQTVISRNHSYAQLGIYKLLFTVSNNIHTETTTKVVSIERPITNARLSVVNTTQIGKPTVFSLEVDLHLANAALIQMEIFYGDGHSDIVTLGSRDNENVQLKHEYTYNTYGIYFVHARVGNNISYVHVNTVVHVGDNITYVDVYSDKQRLLVDDNVTFIVDCPRGAPIKLEIDTGDGNKLVVHRPERVDQYVNGIVPSSTVRPSTPADHNLGTVSNETETAENTPVLDRNKRQAAGDSYETGMENEPFYVVYQYPRQGTYHVIVKVSNKFGYAATELCPDMVVVSMDTPDPSCTEFSIDLNNVSSQAQPLEAVRSSEIVLSTNVYLQCDDASTEPPIPKLTWNTEWAVNDSIWRPELEVCATELLSNNLVIEPNTLWYGLYRFQATASLHVKNSFSNRRRRNIVDFNSLSVVEIGETSPTLLETDSDGIYVNVVPTPLVAQIKDEDITRDVTFWDVVNINMTPSYDPDVERGNQTGMEFFLFCYTNSYADIYQPMTLDELLDESTKFANNSLQTAHLYETGPEPCFIHPGGVWMAGTELLFRGDAASYNDSLIFDLILTKDERVARTTAGVRVWSTNITTDNALDAIDALLASGDTSAALLVIDMATDALNIDDTETDNNTDAKAARSEMRGKLINVLGNVADLVSNYDQLDKTAGALYKVTAVSDEVTDDGKSSAAGALDSAATKADSLAKSANLATVSTMANTMVGAAGNVLPFAEEEEDDQGPASHWTTAVYPTNYFETTEMPATTLSSLLQPTVPPSVAPEPEVEPVIPCCVRENGLCGWIEPICTVVEEDDRKATTWDDVVCDSIHPDDLIIIRERYENFKLAKKLDQYAMRKQTTSAGWGAVNKIGDVINKKQDGAGAEVNINTDKMNMKVAKIDSNSDSLGAFSMPPEVMGGVGTGAGATVMETPNPFTYDDSANSVSGKVMSMSFTNPDGSPMTVQDTDKPIDIWMPGKPDSVPPAGKYYFISSAKGKKKKKKQMNYHTITLPSNETGIHVILRPESEHDVYTIYLKYMGFPNESYYDWKTEIPRDDVFNITDTWKLDQLKYTVFPPTEFTSLNGTYRIGLTLKETRLTLDDLGKDQNFTYTMRVFVSACKFWDETNDTWSSEGCNIGPLTTIRETQCQCNHLTSFGSDMVVPPNSIDFNNVFSVENFLESMPVFCTVIAIILLYIAGMIWARREDKKDLIKWGATPLEDNLPSDTYHYQLTINTGVKKNAGTMSKISFILSGDDSDSGVRRLFDGKRKEFPSGSIYNFVLSVEGCLGSMNYLRIWHDNSGKGKQKGWFLDQVQATDLQTGDKFFFLCNRWFAVEEDDGAVERILPVAGMADLSAFKHLFSSSVRKKLTNDHMWFSVMSRPTKSNFTRVQRISCCVALLFLTMITNCMFFKADEKQENVQALTIGPLEFTLHQLFISVVTTLIVFPPSIAIVSIFRKARPKKNGVMQTNQSLSKRSRKFRWRKFNPGSSLWNNAEETKMQKFKESIRNIITSYKMSKYETEMSESDLKKAGTRKKKKGTLPHWTMYIAWVLVFLSVVVSGFFTILYSMEWGREKSLEWLSTFILSFFQSVVVVQPIKVLLLAAFISCVMRKPDMDEEEESFDDVNVHNQVDLTSSQRDLQELIKQRQLKAADLPPPDTESLKQAREYRMKEIAMEAILKECIVYFFFVLVLFFLSYQVRDKNSHVFASNIKDQFLHSKFESISKPDTFWFWMQTYFLPTYYSDSWYNGKELNWRENLQIDDRNTIRVGVARLRQLRVKDDTCKPVRPFREMINHCRVDYNWVDDDTGDYLPTWIPKKGGDIEDSFSAQTDRYCGLIGENQKALKGSNKSPWMYRSSVELKNAPYTAKLRTYKGGGYTFSFRRNHKKTSRLMQILERQEWVDVRTRAVFTEFTLYNANVNLFASVIMGVEWMATGSAVSRAEVKVFRLSSYVGGFGILVIMAEIIYLFFVIYFFYRMVKLLRQQKIKYFKNFWNLLEFATLVLSVVAIAMYATKKISGTVAINALKSSGSGEYVNFVTIAMWDEAFGFVMALVVFVSTLKFIKMLKFNRRMGMMGDTIKLATKDLKSFCIIFFVYFLAFAQAAYFLFGKKMENYGNFGGTIEALFAFALGDFDFDSMKDAQMILGPLFFFLYVAVVSIGLMGMFLTIIYDSFARVKADSELQSNDYEIVDFLVGKLKGVFGWS